MRTRRRPTPPADANELLAALRAARLLPPKQLRRLAVQWSESRPDEPDDPVVGTRLRARELAAAGLLTAWQVERVLAGDARRLRLGHYRLLDWLGAGGMGSVYKAEHRLMKRLVALKLLSGSTGPGPLPLAAVGRFRREVEAAARLAHPNIVAAHDAIRTRRGRRALVMEYVEGIDLGRLLTRAGPLPLSLACEAVRQTALALQYAHDHGLLHCDVKPSNLLLVCPPRTRWDTEALAELADGRPVRVKLLDMGLARRIDTQEEDDLAGTPDYMAPERGGGEPIDGRSDLYSLGCTFYHLLLGRPPFPGGDGSAKLLRHRIDSPPPICDLRPDLPAAVIAIVERLTARDPADRYPTAADAVAALEECLAPVDRLVRERTETSDPSPEESRPRPLAPRAVYRFPSRMLAAVLCGLLVGATARGLLSAQAEAPPHSVPSLLPFVIEGRSASFASLAEAVAAADDGAVVIVRGPGPYTTPPLTWRDRSLTLRAAPGARPCLEMTAFENDPWQALFTTDRDLILEGLDLRSAPRGRGDGAAGRLVCCERAALRLIDCRLSAPCGAGVVYRNGGELTLQGCRVETAGTAVSVEVGEQTTCTVRIVNTTLDVGDPSGAALALWAPDVRSPTTVEVELTADSIRADRAVALTALLGAARVTARGDRFFFRDALLSCAGYGGRDGWKRAATWDGRDNRYHGPGEWLNIDGAPSGVKDLTAWRARWGGEAGSREERGP